MELFKYDDSVSESIVDYAKNLKGKTLREACGKEIEDREFKGKGGFGQALEAFYFGYEPNSKPEPDFVKVGMELKASPLKKLRSKALNAKERLVLNIINYKEEVDKDFFNSSFWNKNAYLLLVFYLYEKDKNFLDLVVKLVGEWRYPEDDLFIIKQDWEKIKEKILEGKAHELSEGDTLYLAACTKGGGHGKDLRHQPNSEESAKQRAFSLKRCYLDHVIASISHRTNEEYGKIIKKADELKSKSFEDIVMDKFSPYLGISVDEISDILDIGIQKIAKNYFSAVSRSLINYVLGVHDYKKTDEFSKAEVEVKTIRISENDKIKESISFPYFKYTEIVNEEWDESTLKLMLSRKFFWIFFKMVDNVYVLEKVKFWNMPYDDLCEAKTVWEKTVNIIKTGKILKEVKHVKNYNFFPNSSENRVCHVKSHGKNRKAVILLPFMEKTLKSMYYTKHCFWLRNTYVLEEVYKK